MRRDEDKRTKIMCLTGSLTNSFWLPTLCHQTAKTSDYQRFIFVEERHKIIGKNLTPMKSLQKYRDQQPFTIPAASSVKS